MINSFTDQVAVSGGKYVRAERSQPESAAAMDEENNEPDVLKKLISEHFKPAKDIKGSSQQLSTSEVFEVINEHAPEQFSAGDVYTTLTELGFRSNLIADRIKWLLL